MQKKHHQEVTATQQTKIWGGKHAVWEGGCLEKKVREQTDPQRAGGWSVPSATRGTGSLRNRGERGCSEPRTVTGQRGGHGTAAGPGEPRERCQRRRGESTAKPPRRPGAGRGGEQRGRNKARG